MRQLWLVALVACSSKNAAKQDGPILLEDAPSDSELVVDAPIPDAPALAACANPVAGTVITTREVARNLGSAMLVTAPAGDARLHVVVKGGLIRIVDESETLLPDAFLDLRQGARHRRDGFARARVPPGLSRQPAVLRPLHAGAVGRRDVSTSRCRRALQTRRE